MSVNPSLFSRLPYDPLHDFAHIGILFKAAQVLAVHPSVPASSLPELVALARARPSKLRYSSPGNGTPTHIFMEQFKFASGIDLQHVPYKGASAQTAVLSGEVEVLLEGVGPMLGHIRAGKLKALAMSGAQRAPALPEVPTFLERGIGGVDTVWVGVIAPRGVPAAIITRMNRELTRAIESPDLRSSYESLGRIIMPGTPQAMTATIHEEIPRWRALVKRAHITLD
jgi:tripartite-type tricarboxylate transporter receptor subunit TctC